MPKVLMGIMLTSSTIWALALGDLTMAQGDRHAPWGMSVAGNGARAEAAGSGMLKALHNTGWLQHLATISSVSGGSWATNKFAFSSAYHAGITNHSLSIDDWFVNYIQKALGAYGPAAQKCSNCWFDSISAMYKSVAGFDPSEVASPENRHGNKFADLLVCTTLANQGTMSDGSTSTIVTGDGPVGGLELPAFLAIPAQGSGASSTWTIPKTAGSLLQVRSGDKSAPLSLPTPSVATIGAMTSAANAIAATPALKKAAEDAETDTKKTFCTQFPCSGDHLSENAICSDASLSEPDTCAFPSVRFMDGCYADNLGLALNVGYLQKKFPKKTLRIMAVTNNGCDRKTDPSCLHSIHEDAFRSMFTGGPYPTTSGWLPYVVPAVDRTIFAESITDEEVLGKRCAQSITGSVTYMRGTFTTVENTYFGVAADTKVELVVINTNGGAIFPMTPQEMAELGRLAEDVQKCTESIVKDLQQVSVTLV